MPTTNAWEMVSSMEHDRVVEKLLTDDTDHLNYLMDPPTNIHTGGTILHVSCNTISIPHIVYLSERIFDALKIKYTELGGPENCCGAPQWLANDDQRAIQVANMALSAFKRVQPVRVVSTCPDCDLVFDLYKKRFHNYITENVIQVLSDNVDKLRSLMVNEVKKKVVMHYHDDNLNRQRDRDGMRNVLTAIPGLTLLESKHSCGFGNHCMVRMGRIDRTLYQSQISAMFEEAQSLGADSLAVPYHGCYRSHVKQQLKYGIEVVHYLSLVAEAIGISYRDTFKHYRLLDDISKAVDELEERGKQLGYDRRTIREALEGKMYI